MSPRKMAVSSTLSEFAHVATELGPNRSKPIRLKDIPRMALMLFAAVSAAIGYYVMVARFFGDVAAGLICLLMFAGVFLALDRD